MLRYLGTITECSFWIRSGMFTRRYCLRKSRKLAAPIRLVVFEGQLQYQTIEIRVGFLVDVSRRKHHVVGFERLQFRQENLSEFSIGPSLGCTLDRGIPVEEPVSMMAVLTISRNITMSDAEHGSFEAGNASRVSRCI